MYRTGLMNTPAFEAVNDYNNLYKSVVCDTFLGVCVRFVHFLAVQNSIYYTGLQIFMVIFGDLFRRF